MIFSLFYPNKCFYCGKFSKKQICKRCLDKTILTYQPFCIICQNPSYEGLTHFKCSTRYAPSFTIVPFLYSGVAKSIVVNSKYSQNSFSLSKELLRYSFGFSEQFNFHKLSGFTVVPIAGSIDRVNKRGFNLPSLIGKELANNLNLDYTEVLKRKGNVPALYKLKKKQRQSVVKNTFVVRPNKLQKVLLVDDILTSGATLIEACKTLKKSGVKEVACFSLTFRPLSEVDK